MHARQKISGSYLRAHGKRESTAELPRRTRLLKGPSSARPTVGFTQYCVELDDSGATLVFAIRYRTLAGASFGC